MADLFWSPRLTRENCDEIFDLGGFRARCGASTGRRGCIFACLHYGGFEWIALALGLSGCAVHGGDAGIQESAT